MAKNDKKTSTMKLEIHPDFPKDVKLDPIILKYGGYIDEFGSWSGSSPDFSSTRGADKHKWQEAIGKLAKNAPKNRLNKISKTKEGRKMIEEALTEGLNIDKIATELGYDKSMLEVWDQNALLDALVSHRMKKLLKTKT